MIVLGLDLSLTSTGVATAQHTQRVVPGAKRRSYDRLRYIRDQILDAVVSADPDLVVVEGPSYGSVSRSQHERGGLWWMVTESIDVGGIPIGVAPPTNIKKYATGKGGGPDADKDFVIAAAVRKFDWFKGNNDEADALWACAMGHEWLNEPLLVMPALNKEAVSTCSWPELFTFSRTDPPAPASVDFPAPLI